MGKLVFSYLAHLLPPLLSSDSSATWRRVAWEGGVSMLLRTLCLFPISQRGHIWFPTTKRIIGCKGTDFRLLHSLPKVVTCTDEGYLSLTAIWSWVVGKKALYLGGLKCIWGSVFKMYTEKEGRGLKDLWVGHRLSALLISLSLLGLKDRNVGFGDDTKSEIPPLRRKWVLGNLFRCSL